MPGKVIGTNAMINFLDYKEQKELAAWIPSNFDEACKRNAGRRKLHMRKRQARADRIVRLVASMDWGEPLR